MFCTREWQGMWYETLRAVFEVDLQEMVFSSGNKIFKRIEHGVAHGDRVRILRYMSGSSA